MLATQFGAHAMRLVIEGRFGEMVCYHPPRIESASIAEAVHRLAGVDPEGSAVQAARALGISFGDSALVDIPPAPPVPRDRNAAWSVEQDVMIPT